MDRVVSRLTEAQLNAGTGLPGSNSVFQLVVHATSACEWWTSHIVCGHPSDRDRDAEFAGMGSAVTAHEATAHLRVLLGGISADLASATELAEEPSTQTPLGQPWTVGAALIHSYEELAQHLGHMEITADIVSLSRG